MQWFNNIVISLFMNRNIQNVACNFTILFQRQIYLFTWSIHLGKNILNFLWPYLHETVNIWHSFRIWNWRWLLIFVYISNWIYPLQNFFWVFFSLLNTVNLYVLFRSILLVIVSHNYANFGFVWLIQSWLILC